MQKCPRCSADVAGGLKACPKCGLSASKFDAFAEKMSDLEFGKPQGEAFSAKMTKEEKKAAKQAKKEAKKQARKEKKIRESKSDTDFSVYALNNKNGVRGKHYENSYLGRRQKAKDNKKYPEFVIDPATGEYNIDTSDVEIVGEETGRMIEQQHQSYSVKKSRGDYAPKRIKWWELYKLADRHFARRKIKKQVNAASKIKPGFIKKSTLLTLAILFGWCGAHNFYAKNYKKGIFSLVTMVIWMGVCTLAQYVPFFSLIYLSVGGTAGVCCVFVWISDSINIIFNSFKYRLQKEAFLEKLNFNTRAKLGEKYYDMELYKKPFWTRSKVWFARRKREFEEAKAERRQNKIDKQKRKMKLQEEKNQIDAEIARAEKNETADKSNSQDEKLAKVRSAALDDDTLREISSFDGGKTVSPSGGQNKDSSKKKNVNDKKVEDGLEEKPKSQPKNKTAKVVVSKKKSSKK